MGEKTNRKKQAKATDDGTIFVTTPKFNHSTFELLGQSALVYNRMSLKVKQGLLFPSPQLTRAGRAAKLKHDPLAEYRGSVYAYRDVDVVPTRLFFPSAALRQTIQTAALDLPGDASKARIGRLTWAPNYNTPVYGTPQLYMAVVRQAGFARTPDVRTRAILPEWCCSFTLKYASPMLNDTALANLLLAGGSFCGIGDGRQEKGKLSFGQFTIASIDRNDAASWQRIVKNGRRKAQDAALEKPSFFDDESRALFEWFQEERKRRGPEAAKSKVAAAVLDGGGNGIHVEADDESAMVDKATAEVVMR